MEGWRAGGGGGRWAGLGAGEGNQIRLPDRKWSQESGVPGKRVGWLSGMPVQW